MAEILMVPTTENFADGWKSYVRIADAFGEDAEDVTLQSLGENLDDNCAKALVGAYFKQDVAFYEMQEHSLIDSFGSVENFLKEITTAEVLKCAFERFEDGSCVVMVAKVDMTLFEKVMYQT